MGRAFVRRLHDACRLSADMYDVDRHRPCPRAEVAPGGDRHLVFRGSSGLEDMRRSFDIRTSRWAGSPAVVVHRGFHDRFRLLSDRVRESVEEGGGDGDVTFTGHSMGGAVAVMAATWCIQSGLLDARRVRCYVFGTPHIGNAGFVRAVRGALPGERLVCVEARGDVVPRLPVNPGFWSLGNALRVSADDGTPPEWLPTPRRPEGLGTLIAPFAAERDLMASVVRGHSARAYVSIFARLLEEADDREGRGGGDAHGGP